MGGLAKASLLLLAGWLFCGCGAPGGKATLPVSANLAEAEALLQRFDSTQALARLEQAPSPQDWRWRLAMAEALTQQREGARAESYLRSDRPLPDPRQEALRLMHLGWLQSLRRDNVQAKQTFLAAFGYAAQAPNREELEAILNLRYAGVLLDLNESLAAYERMHKAQAFAEQRQDVWLLQMVHGNLAQFAEQEYRFQDAVQELRVVETLLAKSYSAGSAARLHLNLGYCYLHLGDYQRAILHHGKAITAAQEAGVGELARQASLQLASAQLQLGQVQQAIGTYEVTLAQLQAAQDVQTHWGHLNLAEALAEVGELDRAQQHLTQATQLPKFTGDLRAKAYAELLRGRILVAQGEVAVGVGILDTVARQSSYDRLFRVEAARLAGRSLRQVNEGQAARKALAQALQLQGQEAKGLQLAEVGLSFRLGSRKLEEDYVNLLVEQGDWQQAVGFVLSRRLGKLQTKRSSFHASLSQVQAYAKQQKQLILLYFLTEEKSHLWAVPPEGPVVPATFGSTRELRQNLDGYLAGIDQLRQPLETELPAKQELVQALLAPAQPLLARWRNLLLVPDDALFSLNFEALPSPLNAQRFLVEDFTVTVAAMPAELFGTSAGTRSRLPAAAGLFVAGDPTEGSQAFPRLPMAKQEIAEVVRLAGQPGRTTVLEGEACTRSRIQAAPLGSFRRLHFAMHAAANVAEPLKSALILQREAGGSTILAEDVLSWRLQADLVSLSACRSAGARAFSGEGLIGLTWSFLQAGAKDVVAGLWNVDDESTYFLMTEFYRQLGQGLPPESALREAKLLLMKRSPVHRKPYYWAAFQLYRGGK